MRKIIIFLFSFISLISYSQVNYINIDKENKTTDPNEVFINGISSREDIGGVNFEYVKSKYNRRDDNSMFDGIFCIRITNYNSVPVTILFKFVAKQNFYKTSREMEYTQTVVIPATKDFTYPSFKDVSLKGMGGYYDYPTEIMSLISITRPIK